MTRARNIHTRLEATYSICDSLHKTTGVIVDCNVKVQLGDVIHDTVYYEELSTIIQSYEHVASDLFVSRFAMINF